MDLNSGLTLLFFILSLLLAISFHEFAHAWMATRLGDWTPKVEGRLTLNPLAHLDLLGTLFLIFFRFGWGKPVRINPLNFPNPTLDQFKVALAGPASNLGVAILFSIPLRFFALPETIFLAFSILIFLNLVLAIFNLLPIPPLDGSKVLALFISAESYFQLERMSLFLLLGLFLISTVSPIIPNFIVGTVRFIFQVLVGNSSLAPF